MRMIVSVKRGSYENHLATNRQGSTEARLVGGGDPRLELMPLSKKRGKP
jgi:hypothetical protein